MLIHFRKRFTGSDQKQTFFSKVECKLYYFILNANILLDMPFPDAKGLSKLEARAMFG